MAEYDRPEHRDLRAGMDNMPAPQFPGYQAKQEALKARRATTQYEGESETAVDPRENSIGSQLNRLGHLVDSNLKLIQVLEERLSPILADRVEDSIDREAARPGYTTSLGEMVGLIHETNMGLARKVESILKRIEL